MLKTWRRGHCHQGESCSSHIHIDVQGTASDMTQLTPSSSSRWTRRTTKMHPPKRQSTHHTQDHPLTRSNRIRRILSRLEPGLEEIPKDQPLSLDRVESIRMGTTVSTNALLERKGERCALVTSKGWGDILLIGMQCELPSSLQTSCI
jgi:N-methylhydantoinase A/oxoprolinase/acetone carboxylase beta subunit